jgi:hypothetical protein
VSHLHASSATEELIKLGVCFSVRISTTKTYNGGLFIGDFFAMPHGCSVWPAYWSVGPDWPNAGEIDVVEGVNNGITNQMTLHTSDGCTLANQTSNSNRRRDVATGDLINTQCAFIDGDNSGCAFIDPNTTSLGHGFNIIAGGVFAHLWTNQSIQIWHFPRTAIPQDITDMNPNPSSWPTPQAVFTNNQCDMSTHFHDHQLVFDTTICGDFAGSQYPQSGCPGTCAEAVADPTNFKCTCLMVVFSLLCLTSLCSCQVGDQLRRCLPANIIEHFVRSFFHDSLLWFHSLQLYYTAWSRLSYQLDMFTVISYSNPNVFQRINVLRIRWA